MLNGTRLFSGSDAGGQAPAVTEGSERALRMKEKSKGTKTKPKKKINLKTFAKRGLFCAIILYICGSLISQQFDLSRLSSQEKELDTKIAEAQKESKELEAQKDAAGTDEYIERVAREKLGYMKTHEKVFVDASK